MKSILIFHSIKIILHLEPRDAIQTCCQGFLSSGLKSTKLSARMFCLSSEPRLAAGQTQVRVRPGPVTWSPVQLRAETETETGKQERIIGKCEQREDGVWGNNLSLFAIVIRLLYFCSNRKCIWTIGRETSQE